MALSLEQIREYLSHGYFGGKARISGGVAIGITYWEPKNKKLEGRKKDG